MTPKARKPVEVRVVLPWPPSVNGYWRAVGKIVRRRVVVSQVISEQGRVFRAAAIAAIVEQGRPSVEGTVKLREYFYPPDRRRRDLDNFRKAGRDALVHGGALEDDSQIQEDMGFMCRPDPKRPRVEYVIEPLAELAL